MFYRDDTQRDIGLPFIGSTVRHADREGALAVLVQAGIVVTKSSGQHDQWLFIKDYAAMLRRSKVILNFSKVFAPEVPSHQFKGRFLESTMCGALLLEPNNLQTQR